MRSVIGETRYNVAIKSILIDICRANLIVRVKYYDKHKYFIKTNSLCKCIRWKRFALYVRAHLKKPRQISSRCCC